MLIEIFAIGDFTLFILSVRNHLISMDAIKISSRARRARKIGGTRARTSSEVKLQADYKLQISLRSLGESWIQTR